MLAQQLGKILFRFARGQDVLGTALTTMKVKKGKRNDLQLSQLKRALVAKQPVKSESLYDEFHHREVYNRIDTDMESFFFKRAYNLENFNFLINLLGHQSKKDQIPQVLAKMELLNIQPDINTYNYMIKAAASDGDIQLAEKYLEEGVQRFGDSKFFYTSLMRAYIKNNAPEMALKILQEMEEKGIVPDLPVYTTVINSLRIGRKLQKCWEINKMLVAKKVEFDQTYVGVMLKVHAATHDAEKAVKLYQQQIAMKGVKPMLQTTNSYFKALSSRVDYAPRVVDMFFNMVENGEIINKQTIQWAIKAASANGNVKSAIQIVKIMKLNNIQPDELIYNSLIRVYASACEIPDLQDTYRDMILTDTYKILQQVINKNMVSTIILNNVMLTYANSLEYDKIEGLVLPFFEKFNLEMNPYTYEILVDMNYKKKDFNTAMRVWEQMKLKIQEKKQKEIEIHGVYKSNLDELREDLRPTFNMLQLYIQMGIRLMDMNMILEALQMFKNLKRHPKNSTLKFLGNLKNLPIQIQVSLMDFNIRFGAAKLAKTKTHGQRNVKDPQDL